MLAINYERTWNENWPFRLLTSLPRFPQNPDSRVLPFMRGFIGTRFSWIGAPSDSVRAFTTDNTITVVRCSGMEGAWPAKRLVNKL